jgi:hypothetical protein
LSLIYEPWPRRDPRRALGAAVPHGRKRLPVIQRSVLTNVRPAAKGVRHTARERALAGVEKGLKTFLRSGGPNRYLEGSRLREPLERC